MFVNIRNSKVKYSFLKIQLAPGGLYLPVLAQRGKFDCICLSKYCAAFLQIFCCKSIYLPQIPQISAENKTKNYVEPHGSAA
jgi:hypothetical protein